MKRPNDFLTGVALSALGIGAIFGATALSGHAGTNDRISGSLSTMTQGVCVTAIDTADSSNTVTDTTSVNGEFDIVITGSGSYRVLFTDGPDAGCATSPRTAQADVFQTQWAGGNIDEASSPVIMPPAAPGFYDYDANIGQEVLVPGGGIEGLVDDVGANPLDDVTVQAQGSATSSLFSDVTNITGTYELAGLPPDDYTVTFSKSGFATENFSDKTPPAADLVAVATSTLVSSISATMQQAPTPTPTSTATTAPTSTPSPTSSPSATATATASPGAGSGGAGGLPDTGAAIGLYSTGGGSLLGAGFLLARAARRRMSERAKRDDDQPWVNPNW